MAIWQAQPQMLELVSTIHSKKKNIMVSSNMITIVLQYKLWLWERRKKQRWITS